MGWDCHASRKFCMQNSNKLTEDSNNQRAPSWRLRYENSVTTRTDENSAQLFSYTQRALSFMILHKGQGVHTILHNGAHNDTAITSDPAPYSASLFSASGSNCTWKTRDPAIGRYFDQRILSEMLNSGNKCNRHYSAMNRTDGQQRSITISNKHVLWQLFADSICTQQNWPVRQEPFITLYNSGCSGWKIGMVIYSMFYLTKEQENTLLH